MPRLPAAPSFNLHQEMAQAYLVNDCMNQLLLEHLDARAWRAKLPGQQGRTIADIFAHVHNIRRKWLRLSAPHLKLPGPLDRRRCTQKQARAALAESALRCSEMLADALTVPPGRVRSFLRDGWARPWRPGTAMFAYMISHDAHHRGQACMLAHQLGFRLAAGYRMWGWERLWKHCGFELPTVQVKSHRSEPKQIYSE
jgi:uncharacterized damage-inducible protein DinB